MLDLRGTRDVPADWVTLELRKFASAPESMRAWRGSDWLLKDKVD